MQHMKGNYLYSQTSKKILRAFYNVYNSLGYGFLEKVYENAMIIELQSLNLQCEQQKNIKVKFKEFIIGDYFADIPVENQIIIELKASEIIRSEHEAQLINYLKATDIEVGLLLNFGKLPQYKRKILTNNYK